MSEVYIIDAIRTPIGSLGGALASIRPDDLAALVIKEMIQRNSLDPNLVERYRRFLVAVDLVVVGYIFGAWNQKPHLAVRALARTSHQGRWPMQAVSVRAKEDDFVGPSRPFADLQFVFLGPRFLLLLRLWAFIVSCRHVRCVDVALLRQERKWVRRTIDGIRRGGRKLWHAKHGATLRALPRFSGEIVGARKLVAVGTLERNAHYLHRMSRSFRRPLGWY